MYCNYFGCSLSAVASFPILDDEGEEQGIEMLCKKHHPNFKDRKTEKAVPTEASDSLDAWLNSIKETPVSGLVEVTDPINFESVSRLVMQSNSLSKIQNNVRDHRS